MADAPKRDPGLQQERTILSWRRTILALIITDFLIWRTWLLSAAREGVENSQGLGMAAGVSSIATVVLAACILRRALQIRSTPAKAPPAALMKTAAGAVLALAAAVVGAIALSALPGRG